MDETPRRLWLAPLLALLIAGAPGTGTADTVRMKDGSVIHGEVLKIKDDELIIDTKYADEVSIEVEHIVHIEADRSFTIQYKDGRRADGYLTLSPEGKIVLIEKEAATPQDTTQETPPAAPTDAAPVPPATPVDVATPAPIPAAAEPAAQRTTELPYDIEPSSADGIEMPVIDAELASTPIDVDEIRWMNQYETYYRYIAELNVGLSAARGNTDTTDFHMDALLQPSFGLNTLRFSGRYDKKEADGDTTTNQWQFDGAYQRRFKRRWFAFGQNRWEGDTQRDLDLRMLLGTGPGYYFFEDDPTHLSLYGGLAYVRENFSGNTTDRNYAAYFWNTDFDRDLYKDDITFYHDHSFVGAFDDAENIIIQTATGLKFDIWGGFVLSTEVEFDWTNKPANGRDKDDTRYFLKIGYEVEGDETDWWQP